MNKYLKLDILIISMLFFLLPIDMLNGFLLHNQIEFPLSISQAFKLLLISLIFVSFLTNEYKMKLSLLFIFILLLPSLYQCLKLLKIDFILQDLIKISKYLFPIFSFLFFTKLIKKGNPRYIRLIFKLVYISYLIFVFNILIKYLGFGYAMYPNSNIGSKGFFFAGNETSALLIVLCSVLGYRIWSRDEKKKYFIFLLFNLFIGLTISSKTGTLGILLLFALIPLKPLQSKLNLVYLKRFLIVIFIIIPLLITTTWNYIKISPVFDRLNFFWQKLDFWTFIFSNRNNFFDRALNIYLKKYDYLEKIIGIGQARYETINGDSIVEIDIADIFFAYGVVGLILFLISIGFIWAQAQSFKKHGGYPYAGLVSIMVIILLGISTIAGHVFNSGMAAVYVGLLFALMYYKKDDAKNYI